MSRVRAWIQLAAALLFNAHAFGNKSGALYQGPPKTACVPVLNCYSCPGAWGSCPLGALQTLLGGRRIPFYVLGSLAAFGLVLGRAVCGWLCPFGFLQDLLHKLPHPRLRGVTALDRALRWLKYAVLAVFVIILPLALGGPAFCTWLCPAGFLEAGLPLLATHGELAALIGGRFWWKAVLAGAVIVCAVLISRPFCRYLCPLGAFYGLFNKVSLTQIGHDPAACIHCGTCASVCTMGLKPDAEETAGAECIRCGKCMSACPAGALAASFGPAPQKEILHERK